jgi:hypothetical protein
VAHTKGSWKFCKTNGEFIVQGGAVHIDSLHCIFPDVAEVKNRPFESETLSNARLIAAAPELLEALEASRKAINTLDEDALGMGTREDGHGGINYWPFKVELLHQIDTAIAKARGEAR